MFKPVRRIAWELAGMEFVTINITFLTHKRGPTTFVQEAVARPIVVLVIVAATDVVKVQPVKIVPPVAVIAAVAAATASANPNITRAPRRARRIVWLFAVTADAILQPGKHAWAVQRTAPSCARLRKMLRLINKT